jgi:hypothetical protein
MSQRTTVPWPHHATGHRVAAIGPWPVVILHTVTVTTNAEGQGTLAPVLGITDLPAATVNRGSMTVE